MTNKEIINVEYQTPIFQTLAFTPYTLQGHGAESVYGSLMAVLRLSDKRQFFRL